MSDYIFYHGGAEPTFNIEQLDVLRPSQKQQNANGSYAGFYMYSEKDREGAFHYSEQENSIKGTKTKGVVKLTLDSNLKIYEVPPFSITRLTQEQIVALQQQGYDLVCGKVMSKTEYVLLNKDKIKEMKFETMDKRYDYTQFLPEYSSRVIDDYADEYERAYDNKVSALKSLNQIFVDYDNNKENFDYEKMKNIISSMDNYLKNYSSIIPDLYKSKIQEIKDFFKPLEQQLLHDYQTKQQLIEQQRLELERQQHEEQKRQEFLRQQELEAKRQEIIKRQQLIKQQYLQTFEQLAELRKQAIELFNNNIHDETLNSLLRSYITVSNFKNSQVITSEQLNKLYEVYNQFDTIVEEKQKKVLNNNEIKQVQTIQETLINERSSQIEQQRKQISQLISEFTPYRKVDKINNELLKVEQRFEQLKQSSSANLVADQQQLIDWLTNAKNTMLTKLHEQQEKTQQSVQEQSSLEIQQKNEEQREQLPNEYKKMIDNLVDTRKVEQEQALANFNATRQQAQTELINKRMVEIYKTLGQGNVYQQIEEEMNYGGFGR